MLFWNVKKHRRVKTSHVPVAMLREASTRLRPMNMAGYCLPGMCAPHNTSQYIMDQHTYTWRNEEEEAAAKSGESSNYSTVGEDFLLAVPLPSTAQEDGREKRRRRARRRRRAHSLPTKARNAKMISPVKPKTE